MTTIRHHALEVGDGITTHVLSGSISAQDVRWARRACATIPPGVRTLRLDLSDVTQLDEEMLDTVRGIVRDWRDSRDGDIRFDLTTPHLVARVRRA